MSICGCSSTLKGNGRFCRKCGKELRSSPTDFKLDTVLATYSRATSNTTGITGTGTGTAHALVKKTAIVKSSEKRGQKLQQELKRMKAKQRVTLERLDHVSRINDSLVRSGVTAAPSVLQVEGNYLDGIETVGRMYAAALHKRKHYVAVTVDRKVPPEQGAASSSSGWFWGVSQVEEKLDSAKPIQGLFWGDKICIPRPASVPKVVPFTPVDTKILRQSRVTNADMEGMNQQLLEDTRQDTLLGYSRVNRLFRNAVLNVHDALLQCRIDVSRDYFEEHLRPLRILHGKMTLLARVMKEAEETVDVVNLGIERVFHKSWELRMEASRRVCDVLDRMKESEGEAAELEEQLRMEESIAVQIE